MKSLQCLLFTIKSFCYLLSLATLFIMCGRLGTPEENRDDASHIQWSERLGYPSDHIVLILHADDLGMCEEANTSGIRYLEGDFIQSGSAMPPCPAFDEFIQWAKANPAEDVGLHLTLTSEWKTYRWSALSPRDQVPGLTDPEGKMWRSVEEVVQHADAKEVNMEIRTQVEKAISMGFRPKHIDTHMGTLYGDASYTEAYIKVATDYQIPAMVIDVSNKMVLEKFKAQGYPIDDRMIAAIENYPLPKLDYFYSVPTGKTYEEKCENFFHLLDNCQPGLTEIIFHPSEQTENLKSITNSWQQRVWEAQMFSDPKIIESLKARKIIFTNWIEIMDRFKKIKE